MKHCPIDNSVNLLGKKFTLHILRNMIMLKQNRFSHFLKSIEGINTKTLSLRLQKMEDEGLIERKVINNRPVSIEYF
ncbi:winged helix-turn-helix transcriptional regulator, partial [Streptococcus pseudopneumoniae]|uniref:winged helix-turn-helix transcriptional regulator n=1 Tax=Streptococcus pseudopneumoniae TaxID=257758 RepID=UPI001BB0EA50